MKIQILLFMLLAVLLFSPGCTQNPNPEQNSTTAPTAQYGDLVTADYILRVNGTVMDATNADLAKRAGVYDASRTYQPISFRLMLGGQMINGFIKGVVGMRQGETKNFTIGFADGYGPSDPNKITNQSRYYNMSMFEDAPMEYFVSQNVSIEKGKVFPTEVGYVGVEDFDNNTVKLRYIFAPGHKFAAGGLPQTVINITNDTMFIRFDVVQGMMYSVTNPATGKKNVAVAVYVDNETMVLDENFPLAGKDLNFEVTVRSIMH